MSFESSFLYKFKDFRLDIGEAALLRNGEKVPITPKAFELLRILVEHHGSVVKKDALISEIWANSFVEEGNLAFTARLLRKVLDDDAKHPIFIETVPRKGYRFIADVSTDPVPAARELVLPPSHQAQGDSIFRLGSAAFLVLILILLAGGSYFFRNYATSLSSAPILSEDFSAERLTSAGNASVAVISPNGMLVAYTDEANGKWSLWLRRLETAENIQILPPSEAVFGGLVFSSDGNSLFFARMDLHTRKLDIYRVNAFGGIPTKLFEDTQGWMSVSQDDRQVSFVRCKYTHDDYCSLFVGDVDGTNERRVVTRGEPIRIADNQFAPDGRSIAFAAGQSRTGSEEFGLFRIDLDTGSENEITQQRFFNIKYLKWLPAADGLLVTASRNLAQKFSIWKIEPSSAAAIQLTSDDANFSGLSLDQQAKTLVATKVDGDFGLYVNRVRDHMPQKLAAGTSASFTPNGEIVYESPDRDIWVIDTDGTNKRQLTNSKFSDISPIVSQDGRFIFFSSNRSGANHVWRMNIDGSDQKQITHAEGGYPRFVTPDGRWLYYRAGITNSCRRVTADGTEEENVADVDGFAGSFSPDGRSIAYFDNQTAGASGINISVQNLTDKVLLHTTEHAHADAEPLHLQWSSDGRSILYVVREASEHALWRWRLDRAKPQKVMDLGIEPVEGITVSPDGLTIATIQGKWLHDAYLITGLNK